jgi:RNA polymerase sigma factor (sigma-70 family)
MEHQSKLTVSRDVKGLNGPTVPPSFEVIYNAMSARLYLYGCKQTTDTVLVEDGIQDIFCKLYEGVVNIENIHNIQNYLFIALRNYIRKSNRTRLRREWHKKRFQSALPGAEVPYVHRPSASSQSRHNLVRAAIEQLPSRQKEVLHLRYYEGFDYEEISDIMNISYQVARNYASRGMKRLKSELRAGSPLKKAV